MVSRIVNRPFFDGSILISSADHLDVQPGAREMNSNIAGKLGSSPAFRIVKLLNENYLCFSRQDSIFPCTSENVEKLRTLIGSRLRWFSGLGLREFESLRERSTEPFAC